MSSELHTRVKDIFLRACELPVDERRAYVDETCGDDQPLKKEVLSLLSHHDPETILHVDAPTPIATLSQLGRGEWRAWIGRRLGKYEIKRFLDSGGMGAVFEAYDHAIDRRVAIKVLHTELAANEMMRKRLLSEARAAGQLSCSNIVTIYDVADQADIHYLVMEFVDGGSAADHLKRQGAYSADQATAIVRQACSGLSAAHAAGLVHRDIKPANLLITRDGVTKVTDFGVAKLSDGKALHLTRAGQLLGTPHFMSPEQCEGHSVDLRSDIYSLGATYYCLLTGEPPFEDRKSLAGLISAHCTATPPDPRDAESEIPAGCVAIVRRAMAKAPEDRYQSADEMLVDLENPDGAAARKAGSLKIAALQDWGAGKGAKLVAAAAGLLLAAAILFAVFNSGRDPIPPSEPGLIEPVAPVAAETPDGPIRIGVLHSLSGTMVHNERVVVDAYMLAIEELNQQGGVLGRQVEVLVADGQSDETVFAREAARLIDQEKVATLFGCWTSASRKAVAPVVEEKNHLLVYPINTEGIETSPNIVYLGGEPTQLVIPFVRWAYAFQKKRRFFLVGSDYVFPRVVNEILKDELQELGGEVVGEAYIPLGSTDVRDAVEQIVEAAPDAIFNTINGDAQTPFLRQLRDRGVKATLFNTDIGEHELRSANLSQVVGDFSVMTYFQTIDTPANRSFVERFHKKFGPQRVLSAPLESAYAGVWLWAQAVEEAGDTSPEAIRRSMVRQEFDAPGGPIRIDPETQYAYRKSFVGQVTASGQFDIVIQGNEPKKPDPYPDTRTREEWEELLDDLYHQWGERWSAPVP